MRWASLLASVLAMTTAVLSLSLVVHIVLGGGYEMRTLAAMALRMGFLAVLAWRARQELVNPVR
jgi:uncharacterized membrane protein